MATLRFPIQAALRVAQHSLDAPQQRPIAYTDTPVTKPAVLLVHDQGVYLMSNGIPRDVIAGNQDTGHSFVAYADGCDPTVQEFDDWWDTSRALVGGDDFGETLDGWAVGIRDLAAEGATAILVSITSTKIGLRGEFPTPARTKRKRATTSA